VALNNDSRRDAGQARLAVEPTTTCRACSASTDHRRHAAADGPPSSAPYGDSRQLMELLLGTLTASHSRRRSQRLGEPALLKLDRYAGQSMGIAGRRCARRRMQWPRRQRPAFFHSKPYGSAITGRAGRLRAGPSRVHEWRQPRSPSSRGNAEYQHVLNDLTTARARQRSPKQRTPGDRGKGRRAEHRHVAAG